MLTVAEWMDRKMRHEAASERLESERPKCNLGSSQLEAEVNRMGGLTLSHGSTVVSLTPEQTHLFSDWFREVFCGE